MAVGDAIADRLRVAPITGAWIETSGGLRKKLRGLVAPITGAWIETAASSR